MDNVQPLLQVSAKLYQLLLNVPKGEDRDSYITEIHELLDERGKIIDVLQQEDFKIDPQQKTHATLIKLDQGIREKLQLVLNEVKTDLKDLQNTKKNERQYMNPYSDVQVMDGMYYDKKK